MGVECRNASDPPGRDEAGPSAGEELRGTGIEARMPSDESPPSGLPDDADEPAPLGAPDPDPDAPDTGEEAMPGIPTEGEPPDAG
jgi:hypothetical protein